ncbi:MAG: hypothetical protein ACI97A_003999, partial [Planctomycetota bacterium]
MQLLSLNESLRFTLDKRAPGQFLNRSVIVSEEHSAIID